MQIVNCETDKKTLGFVYKLSQVSPWIEFYKDQNQSYTIKGHQDCYSWREILILLLMHLGKFLNIVPLNEVLAQSVFGKNLRQIQPFDYGLDETLAADNQKDLKDQSMQNIIAHLPQNLSLTL